MQHSKQFLSSLKKAVYEFEQSKIMEQIIPRDHSRIQSLINPDIIALNKSLSEPLYDLLDRGGKRIRPFLCMLIADLYNKDRKLIMPIAGCVEIIHNATLIHDDIQDQSDVRRNERCVHIKYGTDVAINAGSHAYFACLYFLQSFSDYSLELKYKLNKICLKYIIEGHQGQGSDIVWHNFLSGIPNIDQYIQMVLQKTGALLKIPIELSCAVYDVDDSTTNQLSNFVGHLGVAFQIQDDILNLVGTKEYKNTKGFLGEDIHEGKLTLMVIHSIQLNNESSKRLMEILKSKPTDQQIIDEAINILQNNGSIDFAQEYSTKIVQQAVEELKKINFDNEEAKQNLIDFAYFVIAREK